MLRENQFSIRYLMLVVLLFALGLGLLSQAIVIGFHRSALHLIGGTILTGMGVGGLLGDIRGGFFLGLVAFWAYTLFMH